MENEKLELDRAEVNALIKAILYLKFECEDVDSLLYCSSPLINSTLEKLLGMYGCKSDWDKVFSVLPNINRRMAMDKISRSEGNSVSFDEKTKNEIIEQYLFPYKLDK